MSLQITSSLGLANEKTIFLDNERRSHTFQPHIKPPESKDCVIKSLLLLDSTLEINLKREYFCSELIKCRMAVILEMITGKKMSPQPTNDLKAYQQLKSS